MALSKEKEIKGISVPYHKIVDCEVKNGYVCVAHYTDSDQAKTRSNMIGGREKIEVSFPLSVSSPIKYAYNQLKESDMSVEPEDYNAEVEGEFVSEEQNFYADAEDC